jgi:hypothetical protein
MANEVDLLEGQTLSVPGINDFDNGSKLGANRAFIGTGLRIDYGVAADNEKDVAKATFGGVNVPQANEAKLRFKTDNASSLIYDRTITAVNQGVSTDERKATDAYAECVKPIVLINNTQQAVILKFPTGGGVPAEAAGKNHAIAVRLDGFDIIG